MNREQDEALEGFADTLRELVELQKQIDESARAIVTSIRVLVDHRADYRPVDAGDYPDHDAAFYDGVGKELGAERIDTLGDFDEAAFSQRNPDKNQTFVRLGLAADGTIGAMWFRLGTASSVALHSWLEDGRTVVTFRAAAESGVPHPTELLQERLPLETTVRDLARRHRTRITAFGSLPLLLRGLDDLLAAYAADEERVSRFREREGLALFEPMMRTKLGERYEEEGEPLVQSIHAHPEWWTGETPASPALAAVQLMFLISREGNGRGHFTTAGMALHGLPELQMKAVAGNHCRAARLLMSVVARKLVRERPDRPLPGLELALTRADVVLPNPYLSTARYPEVEESSNGEPARVRIMLEGFGGKWGIFSILSADPELLHLLPPAGFAGTKDDWLRETCRRLGQDAPAPLEPGAVAARMKAASQHARETIAEFRQRFRTGVPDDRKLLIKVGLKTSQGRLEYVWVQVTDWRHDGAIVGVLTSQPRDCPGYAKGQEMRLAESDIFDRAEWSRSGGMMDMALTDIVAQEFGVDL
jgi:uncharacterized protein YegJ (DUF2314 family)